MFVNNKCMHKEREMSSLCIFLCTIKWYHIDMANVVKPYKATGYYTSGASGFGVRLLAELIKREGICK